MLLVGKIFWTAVISVIMLCKFAISFDDEGWSIPTNVCAILCAVSACTAIGCVIARIWA